MGILSKARSKVKSKYLQVKHEKTPGVSNMVVIGDLDKRNYGGLIEVF